MEPLPYGKPQSNLSITQELCFMVLMVHQTSLVMLLSLIIQACSTLLCSGNPTMCCLIGYFVLAGPPSLAPLCRKWHRNQDNTAVAADQAYIVRDTANCPNKMYPMIRCPLTPILALRQTHFTHAWTSKTCGKTSH